jgi:tRNA U38,U39,U40 pseudouridine synthase TruA
MIPNKTLKNEVGRHDFKTFNNTERGNGRSVKGINRGKPVQSMLYTFMQL